MKFYEVAPASRRYHGADPLTYSSNQDLKSGQIVFIKIRSELCAGFIVKEVSQPHFKTSEILKITDYKLPRQHSDLLLWLSGYYPSPLGITVQHFLPLDKESDYEKPLKKSTSATGAYTELPPLTSEQTETLRSIKQTQKTTLLHGDTGTGKTRIYIELAKEALGKGKSVLVLVPEISLSPQIVKTFTDHVNQKIFTTHSGLTSAKRKQVWREVIDSKEPIVVIGPRSALFSPLENIGLIVLDEFHESAYKQEQAPYYHSIRVASKLAELHESKLVLGSATPPVSESYIAAQVGVQILSMKKKATQSSTSEVKLEIANLRDSNQKTRYSLITRSLLEAIKTSLSQKEQVLLFLNKRGSARVILCQDCGWHAVCDRCDLPFTYHSDTHKLQCHTCGNHMPAPSVCPKCSSHDVVFKSPGTKSIVESIQNAFPEAKIARFDKDNKKAERLETRHREIMSGEIDILIGTQLLAKGHDLPNLSLVGILLAENELQFPDYTSTERSYQLMKQLIGRVDRGHKQGKVVIQTYDPENIAVRAATKNYSWEDFYQNQLDERKQFEFPPFYHLMKIEVTRARLQTVTTSCDQIINFLKKSGEPIKILDPTPSFIEKRNNTWTWQIIVKAKQRKVLVKLAKEIPVKCTVNLDPSNLL